MTDRSETYKLLQLHVEQDLAFLIERGYRILESESSDDPTSVSIALSGNPVGVVVSFDLRDRVGCLRVTKSSAGRLDLPQWDILDYLVTFCGFRGALPCGLSVQQRRKMGTRELLSNDVRNLAAALRHKAPRIVDDTEDFLR